MHYSVSGVIFPYGNGTHEDWEECRKRAMDFAVEQAMARKRYVMVRLVGPKATMNIASADPYGGLQVAY